MLDKILAMIPKHKIYVEAFGGSGKVLLNKTRSEIEVWNDYDKRIANLFYVVVFNFEEFYERVRGLVYSRELHRIFVEELKKVSRIEIGDVDWAIKTYYVLWCTFGGKGNKLSLGAFGYSQKRKHAKIFWNSLQKLVKVRERLSGVIIECDDFEKVIKRWDSEDTFFYLDPPYYDAESYYDGFGREDHKRLLRLLKEIKGKWLLSGYANDLYDEFLKDYIKYEFTATKHSYYKKGLIKRPKTIEVLWCNYKIIPKLF
jgi:DNA adenine methylase